MRLIILILLSICLGDVSIATDDCATKDLNESANSPLRKIPIYDNPKLCYAIASSELADYYLLQHKKDTLVHPVYAGLITTNPDKNSFFPVKGFSTETLKALKARGACDYSDVESRMHDLVENSGITSDQLVYVFDQLQHLDMKIQLPDEGVHAALDTLHEKNQACPYEGIVWYLQKMHLTNVPSMVLLDHLIGSCKALPLDIPDSIAVTAIVPQRHKEATDRNLAGDLPVVASLCSQSLGDTSYQGILGTILKGNHPVIKTKEGCQNHSILITGRKKIDNVCSYLVRNSAGKFWQGDGTVPCACTTQDGNYKSICESGEAKEFVGCWYSADHLFSNVEQTVGFKANSPIKKPLTAKN